MSNAPTQDAESLPDLPATPIDSAAATAVKGGISRPFGATQQLADAAKQLDAATQSGGPTAA